MAYERAIMAHVRCDEADARQIEHIMRTRFSTLDHLDSVEFNREANLARRVLSARKKVAPDVEIELPTRDVAYDLLGRIEGLVRMEGVYSLAIDTGFAGTVLTPTISIHGEEHAIRWICCHLGGMSEKSVTKEIRAAKKAIQTS